MGAGCWVSTLTENIPYTALIWSLHRYLRETQQNDHNIRLRLLDIFSQTSAKSLQIYHNDCAMVNDAGMSPDLKALEYESAHVRAAFANPADQALYQRGITAFRRLMQYYQAPPGYRLSAENMFVLLGTK